MSYSYDRRSSQDDFADDLRDFVIKAIKRVGDGVRSMGLGSVVKYNPQEYITNDDRAVHGTFFLRFEHPKINTAYRPGIFFYWDKSKESGTVQGSNLVWRSKSYSDLPQSKMGPAMLKVAADIVADLKRQLGQQDSGEAWSVVSVGSGHSYAEDIQVFDNKSEAEAAARRQGNCYVVKGTQMWNEPLGQVEDNTRLAPYKFFP